MITLALLLPAAFATSHDSASAVAVTTPFPDFDAAAAQQCELWDDAHPLSVVGAALEMLQRGDTLTMFRLTAPGTRRCAAGPDGYNFEKFHNLLTLPDEKFKGGVGFSTLLTGHGYRVVDQGVVCPRSNVHWFVVRAFTSPDQEGDSAVYHIGLMPIGSHEQDTHEMLGCWGLGPDHGLVYRIVDVHMHGRTSEPFGNGYVELTPEQILVLSDVPVDVQNVEEQEVPVDVQNVEEPVQEPVTEAVEAPPKAAEEKESVPEDEETGKWTLGVQTLTTSGWGCSTAHGRTAATAPVAFPFTVPTSGCYRIDASSGGQGCGFGGPVAVTVVSGKGYLPGAEGPEHAGLTATVTHKQTDGWVALATHHFEEHGLIAQEAGNVDAFRLTYMAEECAHRAPVLATLHLAADYDDVEDKTAFLHSAEAALPWARVLGVSRGSVAVDVEVLAEPSDAAMQASVQALCGLLSAEETGCLETFSFVKYEAPTAERASSLVWVVAACAALLLVGLGCIRALPRGKGTGDLVAEVGSVVEKENFEKADDAETASTVTPDFSLSRQNSLTSIHSFTPSRAEAEVVEV